jgi:general stress protein 26
MSNFDVNNQESIADFVLSNLARHDLMAIATVDTDGKPWVVCVNLSYDNDLNIYWKSAKNSEHSKNVKENEDVGICIFSHSEEVGDFGFYLKAKAREVVDSAELSHAIDVKYQQKGLEVPKPSDFLDPSTRAMYCAVVSEAWINDDRHTKTPVDLSVLRKQAKVL